MSSQDGDVPLLAQTVAGDVLIQSYELSVSCLFVPIFIALFKKQGNFISALLACSAVLWDSCCSVYALSISPREVASILLSLFGYVCCEFIANKRQIFELVYDEKRFKKHLN